MANLNSGLPKGAPQPGLVRGVLRLVLQHIDRRIACGLGAAALLAASGGLVTALAPLALKSLVDDLADAAVHPAMTAAALYLVALGAGRMLAELRPLLVGSAEQQLHARLSRSYFRQLLDLPLSFHLSRPTGALAQTLSQAASGCHLLLGTLLQGAPLAIELATVLVVLSHLQQPALVCIFIASAVAYATIFIKGAPRIRMQGSKVSRDALELHRRLTDSLLNIEAIKCFDTTGLSERRFAHATRELACSWSGLHAQRARIGLAVGAVFTVSVAASLSVSALAVSQGAMSIGGFVLCTVYMLQMVRPLESLGMSVRDLGQAAEFVRPLLDILRTPPPARSPAPVVAPEAGIYRPLDAARSVSVTMEDVHLAYGGHPILRGVSIEVPAGRTLAIVGASGAGKTSIARLLLGLIEPDAGIIRWNDLSAEELGLERLRSVTAMVPQDTVLFDDTVANNIRIGRPAATQEDVEDAARSARLHEVVLRMPAGYNTRVGERGLKLSGGERQRLAIARAILKRPALVILDEPTSMLDVRTEADVLEQLAAHTAGCTTIVITHRLATITRADEIAVMHQGIIVERGSHAQLLAHAQVYAAMWQTQSRRTDAPDHAGRGGRRDLGIAVARARAPNGA